MGTMMNSYQQYRKHDVMMASPAELIVMLYNGGIKFLKLGKMDIEKKDFEAANAHLKRAQDILVELMMGLDLQYEIAGDLLKIYEYLHREVIRINAAKDGDGITPVIEIMAGLREAWVQVQKECKTSVLGLECE